MQTDLLKQHRRSPSVLTFRRGIVSMEAYEAFRLSTSEKRYLEIRPDYPECTHAPSYMALTQLVCDGPYGRSISLYFGTALIVQIRGSNLQQLFTALKEWKVDFIQSFDAEIHKPVEDTNAPFIKMINIIKERPEPPPPANQRH